MMLLRTLWRFCGVAAAVLAWIVIALAISANPWFDVFKHALSDLGGPSANMPQVYNFGLIATGIAICTYSLYIAYASKARVFDICLITTLHSRHLLNAHRGVSFRHRTPYLCLYTVLHPDAISSSRHCLRHDSH
jgi:hypothetical protein